MRNTFRLITVGSMAGLLLPGFGASAQDVSQEDLAACAAKGSAAERLACYESLAIPAEPATPVAEPSSTDAPATSVESETKDMPESTQSAPPVAAPLAADAANTELPEIPATEQSTITRSSEPDEPVQTTAIVHEVSEGRYGNLYFHLDNGEVWRQNEARRFRHPKNEQFEVILSKGMMGDYRLRIGDDGPMTRVSRVE